MRHLRRIQSHNWTVTTPTAPGGYARSLAKKKPVLGFPHADSPTCSACQEFSSWLSAAGWSEVEIESSQSPEYWRVWATREDTQVAEAMVTWFPAGDVDTTQPHVVLDVDSTCSPADVKT